MSSPPLPIRMTVSHTSYTKMSEWLSSTSTLHTSYKNVRMTITQTYKKVRMTITNQYCKNLIADTKRPQWPSQNALNQYSTAEHLTCRENHPTEANEYSWAWCDWHWSHLLRDAHLPFLQSGSETKAHNDETAQKTCKIPDTLLSNEQLDHI